MKVYVGNDHAGVAHKKKLLAYLKNHTVVDLGSQDAGSDDDYVDFAVTVAKRVVKDKAKGILLCGSGSGMVIAANKVKGVRASLCYDSYTAKMARRDNDANILCLRSRGISFEKQKSIIKIWLSTKFSQAARHKRRIKKVNAL